VDEGCGLRDIWTICQSTGLSTTEVAPYWNYIGLRPLCMRPGPAPRTTTPRARRGHRLTASCGLYEAYEDASRICR
jgi:hypothetical protein